MREDSHKYLFDLTPGQKQVADLLEKGMDITQICKELGKKRHNVHAIMLQIREKQRAMGKAK
jgi:DNA-binding CsgD family transcriptional regulator